MSERDVIAQKAVDQQGILPGDFCDAARTWQGRAVDDLLRTFPNANVITQKEALQQNGKPIVGPLFIVDEKGHHGHVVKVECHDKMNKGPILPKGLDGKSGNPDADKVSDNLLKQGEKSKVNELSKPEKEAINKVAEQLSAKLFEQMRKSLKEGGSNVEANTALRPVIKNATTAGGFVRIQDFTQLTSDHKDYHYRAWQPALDEKAFAEQKLVPALEASYRNHGNKTNPVEVKINLGDGVLAIGKMTANTWERTICW